MKTSLKQGYLIIETPTEEEDITTLREYLEEDNDENINSIDEQGNKLIVGVLYEEIEEVGEIASNIIYNCISLGIYSVNIKYCGKETNSKSNRISKSASNSLSSNNRRNTTFDSYIRGSLTI